MKPVVMPAARETTVWVGCTAGAISASKSGMSCGFTTRTSVSAFAAASTLDTTSTPYRSRSSVARSSRRSVIRSSSGRRPARISPDSNVSPITPAPRMATRLVMSNRLLTNCPDTDRAAHQAELLLADQGPEEELEVGGALGQPAYQVAVPVLAVRDVDADRVPLTGQAELLLRTDAVEHLVLEAAGSAVGAIGEGARDRDQPRVVRRDHRVAGAVHQDLHRPDVRLVDLTLLLERDRLRLLVRTLAEADAGTGVRQVAAVGLGPPEVRLQDRSGLGEVLAQLAQDTQRGVGRGVVLHVEGHRRTGVAGGEADGPGVLQRDLLAVAGQRLADRGQFDRDLGVLGEAGGGELLQQVEVRVGGGLRGGQVGDVLAEVVEGDVQPVADQLLGGQHGLRSGLAGDEPRHDATGHRERRHRFLDLGAAGH